jgi:hypothetical protein
VLRAHGLITKITCPQRHPDRAPTYGSAMDSGGGMKTFARVNDFNG